MSQLLATIASPADLHKLNDEQLLQLAQEMRDELVRVLSIRPAHFASNLGVVELCLALHLTFDFSKDRLIWDTGHQIYPHKLITGRYQQFETIRTRGGLMGYPNPHESPYDLFMTGHAGCSVSCALGLRSADDLLNQGDRYSVAVVGDGALPSGIVFEALNHAGHLNKNFLVILNDNKMSICPRVGALATALDRARLTGFYQGSKRNLRKILSKLPLVGGMATAALDQIRDGLKALFTGGMLFEELGFRYIGPVDGHDLAGLRHWLQKVKMQQGPILLHILTEKGHGVPQASQDPVTYHTPPVFEKIGPQRTIVSLKRGGSKAYTDADRGHVPGEQTREGPLRFPRPFLRRGHLRIARGRIRRGSGQGRYAAYCRHLLHVFATRLRPGFPGSVAAKLAGNVLPGPRGPDRAGRADASRHLRHLLPAHFPALCRDGPWR